MNEEADYICLECRWMSTAKELAQETYSSDEITYDKETDTFFCGCFGVMHSSPIVPLDKLVELGRDSLRAYHLYTQDEEEDEQDD